MHLHRRLMGGSWCPAYTDEDDRRSIRPGRSRGEVMTSERNTGATQLERRLGDCRARIDRLEREARERCLKGDLGYEAPAIRARRTCDELRARLEEARAAVGAAREAIETDVKRALTDVTEALEEAERYLKASATGRARAGAPPG